MSAKIRGGDTLRKKLEEISRELQKNLHLKAGFLAGAAYDDGTPIPQVAAENEFGTAHIPPCPFMHVMPTYCQE